MRNLYGNTQDSIKICDKTSAAFEIPMTTLEQIKFLFCPTKKFLQQKYTDYRLNAIVVITVCTLLWASLWYWDRIIDPVGAEKTLSLRLLFLTNFFFIFVFILAKKISRWLTTCTIAVCLISELLFIEILNRLNGGMTYGLAGFMYCMLVAVLLFKCFSILTNYSYTILSSALPHLAGTLGFVHNFPHLHYALLIWPAALLAVIIQSVQAHDYLLRYHLENELKELSNTDPLTGTKNRRYFMNLLDYEIHRAVRTNLKLSLLVLDIDSFKNINDTYGHPTGDMVISQIAEKCSQLSRDIDIVARMGGEEFSILLLGSNIRQAENVAERIRSSIEDIVFEDPKNKSFNCTVSIGIAELESPHESGHDLFIRADKALYEAKKNGRNKVVTI
ncbi:GGDEF domain-containing protein [Maridesulfovibrio bastinii]|uniref:GGDEF domain-containing protein n=1 Tax=Maridesulfovibrio bastinii TaxID=47157 RepID=UPI00040E2FD5|nr:GGDEF domain-containing protein [Maridesulfovibrio bastinii]